MVPGIISYCSANSGIGKELSTYAAAKGAKLYMLCRSKDRAEKAREEVVKVTSNDDVEVLLVSTTRSPRIQVWQRTFVF